MPDVHGVFISYRREDSRHVAGRLSDALAGRFGSQQVFMDVDSIAPGLDFAQAIETAVSRCDALLALIGPGWVEAQDSHGRRRLDDPDDFVVLEITAALARDIRVVPVLVDGAALPDRDVLPVALQPLLRRHAVRLDHESFRADSTKLLDALDRLVGVRQHADPDARPDPSVQPEGLPGTEPQESLGPVASGLSPGWTVSVTDRGWSKRTFELRRGEERFTLLYRRQSSYEAVLVDGHEVARYRSWVTMSAGLGFSVGEPPSSFKVFGNQSKWGNFTSVNMLVDDALLYSDTILPAVNVDLEKQLDPDLAALSQALKKFAVYSGIYVAPRVPPGHLANARTSLDLPTDADVAAIVNLSPMGSAKAALAFLGDRLVLGRSGANVVLARDDVVDAPITSHNSANTSTVNVGATVLDVSGSIREAALTADMIEVWRAHPVT